MHWFNLPEVPNNGNPALPDLEAANNWLASQTLMPPQKQLAAINEQIESIDAGDLPPPLGVELLDRLRQVAIPILSGLEARYLRKPLPLLKEEQEVFDTVVGFWRKLGIAHLRLAPYLLEADQLLPLHRAAIAFRLTQMAHYQASQACPELLDQLLFAVLFQADNGKLLHQPLLDPEFPYLGEAHIAGLLAWAFLLRQIDPYHLSTAQLAVANRALSRWRELCDFQLEPDAEHKSHTLDLATLIDGSLPESIPRHLNIRSVLRKTHSRKEALKTGETPEALKLGRELSAASCLLLLDDIEHALRSRPAQAATNPSGDIELAFGAEHAFSVCSGGKLLNPDAAMDARSTSIAHQRMALFGFDNIAQLPTAVQRVDVPSETWQIRGDQAFRKAQDGARHQAPCLIATFQEGKPRLGVLSRLISLPDHELSSTLSWYGDAVEACTLKHLVAASQNQPRIPAFLLLNRGEVSLIVPIGAGVRLDIGLALEGASIEHLVPTSVVERGIDFIRYAYRTS
jgi:hypothetical protein